MNNFTRTSLMKNGARILFTLVLDVGLFGGIGYTADEKAKPNSTTASNVEAAWQRRIPELRIDQLPLSEVARYLRQREHFPEVNFIVPASAGNAAVAGIDLRSVTLDDILTAIELASEGCIHVNVHGQQLSMDAAGLPVLKRATTVPTNLVAFTFTPPPISAAKDQNLPVCRVFSLAPYLAYKSEEDSARAIKSLYEALDDAWDMLKRQVRIVQPPDLRIHSGTKLLIAVGGERELAVVEQMIKELQGSAPTRTVAAPAENELKPKTSDTHKPPAAGTKP